MRFVVFGLTVSSSWGNGHATLWRGLSAALGRMGHALAFFERDEPWYASHRDLFDLPGGTLELYDRLEAIRPRAERALAGCDVAIVTSFCPDALAAAQLVLDSSAAVKAFYDMDTGVTLAGMRDGRPVPWIGPSGLADFDLVLSSRGAGRSRSCARRSAPDAPRRSTARWTRRCTTRPARPGGSAETPPGSGRSPPRGSPRSRCSSSSRRAGCRTACSGSPARCTRASSRRTSAGSATSSPRSTRSSSARLRSRST